MELNFPSNAGRPYCRLDGRTGAFALSVPDGDPEIVEMKGKLLDLDIAGAEQGWLRLDANGAAIKSAVRPPGSMMVGG